MALKSVKFARYLLGVLLGLGCLALLIGLGDWAPPSPRASSAAVPARGARFPVGVPGLPVEVRAIPHAGQKPALRGLLGERFGRLDLRFEPNQGQTDSRVRFLSRGSGFTIFLTDSGAVLALERRQPAPSGPATCQTVVLGLRMLGASSAVVTGGEKELAGKTHYLIGRDASSWHTGIPNFEQVRYRGLYPGVDLVFYGSSQRQLEYDFVLAPGADPGVVRMKIEGPEKLSLDEAGNLIFHVGADRFVQHAPVVYQERDGRREPLAGNYRLLGEGGEEVGFEVAAYDRDRALIIDPVVGFATYLGTASADDLNAVGVDPKGFIYAGGASASSAFPTTAGVFQGSLKGAQDCVICKFDPDGTQLLYSTFLGGLSPVASSADEKVTDLAVNASGLVFLTGFTQSSDFPLASAFQGAHGGGSPAGRDAFVSCLNATGSGLVYSSYLGGSGDENTKQAGIVIDASDNAYISGSTQPGSFPVLNPIAGEGGGGQDGFVAKIDSAGVKRFASLFGQTGNQDIMGIAVDSSGYVYICGQTDSSLTTVRGAQAFGGGTDAFVGRLAPSGSTFTVDYSTFLGGSLDEAATEIAVDGARTAYVTGGTLSSNFPVTAGVVQAALAGGGSTYDAFVTAIPHTVSGPVSFGFSTYLGGSNDDNFSGSRFGGNIGLDSAGNIWIIGKTISSDFPLKNAFQTSNGGSPPATDAFVAGLNSTGTTLLFASYYGGSGGDTPFGLAVEKNSAVLFCGTTMSSNLPLTAPFQGSAADANNGYLVKLLITLPQSANDSYAVSEDASLSVPDGSGVLANDTSATKATLLANVSKGSLTLNGNGSFLYTPNADFFGTDTFTYRASNASISEAGSATVTITVNPVNDAPVASDDSFGGSAGRKLGIPKPGVLGNDPNVDGDTLNAVLIANAARGALSLNADGSFEYLPQEGFTGTDTFTYQATDGSLTSNTATVTLTTALATDLPSVTLAADPGEGFAPLTTTFTATATDPNSVAISQYSWNLGDGTAQATSSGTLTHTYAAAGSYVVSLYVTNANGLSSDPLSLPVPVADGQTGDGDLFMGAMKFKIDFGKHAIGQDNDSLNFTALLNPAGLPADLGAATLTLRFNNGLELGSGAPRGRLRGAQERAGQSFLALLSPSTGQLKVKAQKVDLRTVLGIQNKTAKEKVRTEVEVEVSGVSIDTPKIRGVFEADLSATEGKSASSSFSFLALGNATLTGAIKSQRTGALETSGGHLINAQGPLVADLSSPLVPTGDLAITIGAASQQVVILVPLAALQQSGSGAGSILTYSKSLLEVAELKKFQIDNRARKFILSTNELAGTGIPTAGSGSLAFDLPIAFDAVTAEGTLHLETTVQIRRPSDSSKVWKR